MLEAARHYRDKLGWAVHPLCGPRDQHVEEKARGKKPLLKNWPAWTIKHVTDETIIKHFGSGLDTNLGVVIRAPQIVIDLDSKKDRGESVRQFLAKHPELNSVPRERTDGGAHLHLKCPNLPAFTKNGKPYEKALVAKLENDVTAELFFDGLNVVISPSIHRSGSSYVWEVVWDIPVVRWEQLQKWFGFQLPDATAHKTAGAESEKPKPWWKHYKGDLRTLDLPKLLQSLGRLGEVIDVEQQKIAVHCPWQSEHSDSKPWSPTDSSTVIFAPTQKGAYPGFRCLHAHCDGRGLKEVLEFCEGQQPGIVDKHCSRSRVWHDGQTSKDRRPRVVLPGDFRPDSTFAKETVSIIAPKQVWFVKSGQLVAIRRRNFSEKVRYFAFSQLQPAEVCTAIEEHIETGLLRSDEGELIFVPRTMEIGTARKLVVAPQFISALPEIGRILDVSIPVLHNGKLVFPKKGYDERFQTFCDPNAPDIAPMTLEEALHWLAEAHAGFCWKSEQDLVHALARIITPFLRGIMGWDARFPIWFYQANRPRGGKDYLAGVKGLVYEGFTCEDAPLSNKDSDETRKRITTALLSGRRCLHFANCQGYLESKDLMQAATSNVWGDRVLGGNTEVKLPNELEFSLSANLGLTYRADFEPRFRIIRLFYPQEEANSRMFPKSDLHGFVLRHRDKILSAIAALVTHWDKKGRPDGPTPFTSFPQWGRIVGGIMNACGLGDPCLPHEEDIDVGGDQLTRAMKEVFRACYQAKPEMRLEKKEIYEVIQQCQADSDTLNFFGDLTAGTKDQRSAQIKLGMYLSQFTGRELGGIKLERIASGACGRTDRAKFRFTKPQQPSQDHGSEIAKTVFGATKTRQASASNGDVGEVCNSGKADENVGRGEKEEARSVVVEKAPPNGVQHRQYLNSSYDSPIILACRDDLQIVATAIRESAGPVALDLETYGQHAGDALDPFRGDIRLLTLAIPGHHQWLVDLRAIGYNLGALKEALENVEIVGHNLKFDMLWMKIKCGLTLNRVFCAMTASRLLTAGTNEPNDLAACLHRHLRVEIAKDQARSNWGQSQLTSEQLNYAANDVHYLHDLKSVLEQEIENTGLVDILNLELALLPVVVAMEARGIAVDAEKLQAWRQDAESKFRGAETSLRACAGMADLNPSSPQQLLRAFANLGTPLADTKEETLMASVHPLAKEVLAFRRWQKQQQQAEKLLKCLGKDGRIHASFNPAGTETGRFSSSKPNLQNIGRGQARECFVPAVGKTFIVADYSQIELRAAAAIAQEAKMIEAYHRGEDLHKQTAALVLSKPIAEVTREDRQLAKAVNFGLLYGQAAEGLVRYAKMNYGVDLTKADGELFRTRFFSAYAGLRRWHEQARQRASNVQREVRTVLGRRRLLPSKWWEQFTGLVNTAVQGSCADGLKLAMVELANRLPSTAGIVSTVHDEIIVESPVERAEEIKGLVTDCMVQAMQRLFPDVPIEVEAKVCPNWGAK
jgi:DNA polymerase-1